MITEYKRNEIIRAVELLRKLHILAEAIETTRVTLPLVTPEILDAVGCANKQRLGELVIEKATREVKYSVTDSRLVLLRHTLTVLDCKRLSAVLEGKDAK